MAATDASTRTTSRRLGLGIMIQVSFGMRIAHEELIDFHAGALGSLHSLAWEGQRRSSGRVISLLFASHGWMFFTRVVWSVDAALQWLEPRSRRRRCLQLVFM